MGFMEDLENETVATGRKCWYVRLSVKDPNMAAGLDEGIAAGYSYSAVARASRKAGLSMARTTIASHYRGDCKCPTNQ